MSWNESGNQQDPWGKPGQKKPEQQAGGQEQQPQDPKPNNNGPKQTEQQPPDLEEVFSNLLKKMGGNKGNKNGTNPNHVGPSLSKSLPILLGLGAAIWGATGFYTIQEAERGVVTRFGKLHNIVQPGLNWKPTFVDEVRAINIQQVSELSTKGSMLTQDENMVMVEMTVQYRVEDPAKYAFNVKDPDESLKQATDSALRYVIGHMTMDDILTIGRATVRERTWSTLRDIIKNYDIGLLVTDVNFQYARPPEEVKAAFDDAIKAQEDEQRLIREAEAYARGEEPIARGNAQRIIEQATAYKEQVVLNAQGEVERFSKVLPEYKAAPTVTRDRLYIQTMEKVMKNTPKLMVDSSDNNLTVLAIDKLMGNKANEAITQPAAQTPQQIILQPVQVQPTQPSATQPVNTNTSSEPVRRGRF